MLKGTTRLEKGQESDVRPHPPFQLDFFFLLNLMLRSLKLKPEIEITRDLDWS